MATRITVIIESINEAGAGATGRATQEVKGFANQKRIIIAGSEAFKAAVAGHRVARRNQRVRHGQRV